MLNSTQMQHSTYRDLLERAHVLAGEDKSGGAILAVNCSSIRGCCLLRISRTEHVQIGEHTKPGDGLNGLVSRSILCKGT